MESKTKRTILGLLLFLFGIGAMAVFSWNIFALNLPVWADIPAMIIGIPAAIWGIMYFINANKRSN